MSETEKNQVAALLLNLNNQQGEIIKVLDTMQRLITSLDARLTLLEKLALARSEK